ncbi:MAG TPA: DUF3060 domain-containing protein [Kofleriaceae bacterium]|nr:DUF3060 domain-containing protein [Kofleriaceae bacterium]
MKQLVVSIAAVISLAGPSIAHADKTYRGGKGASWDCKQDPVVNILHGNGTYTLKGSCKTVNVTGGQNTLTIASAETLTIQGGRNSVTIDAVDAIQVIGSDNTVTYKGTVHGDNPSITSVGSNNAVTGGGGAGKPGGDKPAGAGKPAEAKAPAGAHDCARQPTAVINEGDGNYRFVGPCTRIVVNGGDNTLAIESIEALTVNGSTNAITIGSADRISVNGAENKISYRKGLSGAKPRLTVIGQDNQVTQIK